MTSVALYFLLSAMVWILLLIPFLALLYAHGEREAAMRDRAVSPLVGILLMITITVIVGAVVLTFIVNL